MVLPMYYQIIKLLFSIVLFLPILRCKHNAICYYKVGKAVASGILRIAKIDTKQNLADMFTEPLPAYLLHELIIRILY
jgi:hypothetical protein